MTDPRSTVLFELERHERGKMSTGKYRILTAVTAFLTVAVAALILQGCSRDEIPVEQEVTPNVVTADIQAGIEKHIEIETAAGNGYYRLPFEDRELWLKLVKVHTEYLANLGPRSHFACVDLIGTDGEVYDVDFFLEGDPGSMRVTDSTVHKINGQPLYLWQQLADQTWQRVPVDEADNRLMDVIQGTDEFEFRYTVELPEITGEARLWIPIPRTDAYQTVEVRSMEVPGKQSMLHDEEYGNTVLYLELSPEQSSAMVDMRFQVKRREKSAYAAPESEAGKFLKEETLVPLNDTFRAKAKEIVNGKKGELVKARAIYDYVIDDMRYQKANAGYGKGDAVYACDVRTGNCTDYHSYFIALCRAAGIPARFAIGAPIPSARNTGRISGYHCWAEFYAEGKWWPVDVSEADKYSALASYYFSHHPANRIELSRGRDLKLNPGPASGPINFLAYPLLEMDGKTTSLKPLFSYMRETLQES